MNNVLFLFSPTILYLLLSLSALNFVVHYRASGNTASEMLLIDGSEAKLQGLLQCLSALALLSPGIAFNLYHPTAGCKPVCFLLSRSLMQTSEQQQISGMHKEKATWGLKVSRGVLWGWDFR